MDLRHARLQNVKVQAFRSIDATTGGPVLLEPQYRKLRHWSRGRVKDSFQADGKYAPLDGEWNYLGPMFNHFGHIMSETIHRVLPSRRIFEHDRWLGVADLSDPATSYEDLNGAFKAVAEFLGIGSHNLKVINADTIVGQLNICEQGSSLGGRPSAEYLAEIGAYSTAKLDALYGPSARPRKLYVSRAAVQHGGNILGERYVGEVLKKEGFAIFKPETWSLSGQMDHYRKAEVLVFPEGSACHGLELLGELNEMFLIMRRPEVADIFDGLALPRAKRYARFQHPIYIGTAVMHRYEGRVLPEWGASILDIEPFLAFMRSNGVAAMTAFDEQSYWEAARADLDAYISFHRANGSWLVSEKELERLRDRVKPVPARPARAGLPAVNVAQPLPSYVRESTAREHDGCDCLTFLGFLNEILKPRTYLEIGAFAGESLRLFHCDSISVSPKLHIETDVINKKRRALFFQQESDEFFKDEDVRAYFKNGPDLVFLDGMISFEFLLKDFMNAEKVSHAETLILIRGCLPGNARAFRRGESEGVPAGMSAGDAWQIMLALNRYRDDLVIRYFDCPPAGLVAVGKLDRSSRTLEEHYDEVVAYMMGLDFKNCFNVLWMLYPMYSTEAIMKDPAHLRKELHLR